MIFIILSFLRNLWSKAEIWFLKIIFEKKKIEYFPPDYLFQLFNLSF